MRLDHELEAGNKIQIIREVSSKIIHGDSSETCLGKWFAFHILHLHNNGVDNNSSENGIMRS